MKNSISPQKKKEQCFGMRWTLQRALKELAQEFGVVYQRCKMVKAGAAVRANFGTSYFFTLHGTEL
jgi:hypothetical protein